jgi:hypothetical protein
VINSKDHFHASSLLEGVNNNNIVELHYKQITTIFIAFLLTSIIYVLASSLNMLIIFVISLNALLVFIGFMSATSYDPNPLIKYAAAAGTLIFVFIVVENILAVL